MTRGRIPDRWEEYEPVGKVIPGTRFIAFKVPLNPELSLSLPRDIKRFLPENLPAAIREQDRELGLVIDLTNTRRYYREEDILKQGIEYQKIFTEGHSIPSKDVQNCFFTTVDNFLSSNTDNERVIGVHCTHGLNRTGYLVCRYMIDRMNFKADDAIKAFNEARGHDMERQNYLSDLRGEPVSDVPSPNKDRRMERKRMASSNDCLEDSAVGPHSNSKQRCLYQTMDDHSRPSSMRQSGAGNHRSQGHNGSRSGQNSQSYYGNGNRQRNNYRQNSQHHTHSYYQHNNYDDFARQPRGYYQQSCNVDQNNFHSDGCWRQEHGYDRYDYADQHNFASNDFSNHSNFSGPSFPPHGGRPHGQRFERWGQRDSRLEHGRYGRNHAAGTRTYDDHYQRSN